MKPKEIIVLNNEKRELLNDDNLKDYEDMLTYIRISSTKSEQQTEEILLELLEHVLLAQDEDKTVRDIFGNDLKSYCQELIGEIPKETKKKQFKFAIRMVLIFLGVASFFNGVAGVVMYYFFDIGESTRTYYVGSSLTIIFLNLITVLLSIVFVLNWIKSSIFKDSNKKSSGWIEFLKLWVIMTLITGLFFSVVYFMPNFGTSFSLPIVSFTVIGIGLYALSYAFKD